MLRYVLFALLVFKSLISFSQQYSDDYTVAEFKEIDLVDLKTGKINPKSIENLFISTLGEILEINKTYISSLPIKKLTNLKKLYLRGDDYDYSLKEIPIEFLRLKNLKIIILENVAYTFSIINHVKRYRPDIIVKSLDYGAISKFLTHRPDSLSKWRIKIVYPNKIVSQRGFEIDSILRKENLNSNDYLILSQSYISSDNSNDQLNKTYIFWDSLYTIYGDSMCYKCKCEPPYTSSADTVKACDYLNKALALDDTSHRAISFACFFYQNFVLDKNKACYYFKKILSTPPPHYYHYKDEQYRIYIPSDIKKEELEDCDSNTH